MHMLFSSGTTFQGSKDISIQNGIVCNDILCIADFVQGS